MRRRFAIAGVLALAISVLAVPGASASTEFGDNCAANGGAEGYSFVPLQAPGDPLPLTAPSSGVITQWKQNVNFSSPPPVTIRETLLVLRPAASPLQFAVVGESGESAPVVNGQNSFPARIPVQAGDRLGLTGILAPLFCMTSVPGDAMGVVMSPNPAQGSTLNLMSLPEFRVPATAVIEPDADGDGFGDETQDKCPQSAAVQTECPTVTVEATASAKRSSVTVLVTTSNSAPVTVAGTVKLGKGKSAKLSSKGQTVSPGKISRFTLKFPQKLKAALGGLSSKHSLKLKVTASATDLIGRVASHKLTVKLKGQAKG